MYCYVRRITVSYTHLDVYKRQDVDVPRAFPDYEVSVKDGDLPNGVQLIRRVG